MKENMFRGKKKLYVVLHKAAETKLAFPSEANGPVK